MYYNYCIKVANVHLVSSVVAVWVAWQLYCLGLVSKWEGMAETTAQGKSFLPLALALMSGSHISLSAACYDKASRSWPFLMKVLHRQQYSIIVSRVLCFSEKPFGFFFKVRVCSIRVSVEKNHTLICTYVHTHNMGTQRWLQRFEPPPYTVPPTTYQHTVCKQRKWRNKLVK